jgi:hypothetical protein
VISDIINNTSVIIVYCFGLLAAIGAEVVASSAPRATLVGGNAETIATLWVRGGAALATLVIVTLISVKVSSTSVNTVNIASNSDQPDQKTRHDKRSETQAPEGSNPSSGSHGLPSPSIIATELGDDFKSCYACSCNDSCNSSLRSAVSCPLSIIESSDGSDCDDRVVNDNTFFFGKPEQGEPHAPVFGTQHNCSHARVSQWLDDNLPAQSTGLEGCDSPHADAHSDCLCKHSPPSLVHPNGTPTLESEYHRPCAGSRSENSTANAVDDTGSTSDCCKCTGSSSGNGGVPGPVDRPARRPDQLTIGPAVTVRAASYRYVLWHIVASALLAAILCAVIRLATASNSTQQAAALLYNYQTNDLPDSWLQTCTFTLMTLLTAFPTVAQNLGRLSKELIKRIYHCSRISSMIIGTICMLCSSYILSWTQYLTSSVTKLLQSALPDRIRRSWFRPTRDARRARRTTFADPVLLQATLKGLLAGLMCVMLTGLVNPTRFQLPAPVLVGDTSRPIHSLHLPPITATSGVELMDQIDAWMDSLLIEHFRYNHTERTYIMAFKAACGRLHPAYTLMSQPQNDDELNGKTPEEEAIRRADAATISFRAHARDDGINRFLNLACADVYPEFGAPRDLVSAIAYAELEITRPNALLVTAQEAQKELKMLDYQLAELVTEHSTRTGIQKLRYIGRQDDLKHHVPDINQMTKLYRQQEEDERRLFGADRQVDPRYQQYQNVTDFVGLMWLRDYLLLRLGAISVRNVKRFEQLRMLKNENPSQAYARVRREAELLERANVSGFNMHIALHELITTSQHADDHSFLTKTLYNRCFPIVQNQMIQRRIKNNDHEAKTQLWIEIADRLYFEEVGRDTPTDRDMQAELNKHQAWHDKRIKDTTGVVLNDSDRKHQKYCELHGKCNHTTAECNLVQQLKAEQRGKRNQRGETIAVTQSQPGADLVQQGTNPNSKFHKAMQQQQQQEQQQQTGQPPRQRQNTGNNQQRTAPLRCAICSLVAGEDYLHNPKSCFLDGTTPIPDWWQPNNPKILKRANELRKARNQPPLQSSTPVAQAAPASNPGKPGKAKQVGFVDTISVVVPDVPFVGMMSLDYDEPSLSGYTTADPTAACAEHLNFELSTRTFTCKRYGQPCEIRRDRHFGMLVSVKCNMCHLTFPHNRIPRDWRLTKLWTHDPSVLPPEHRKEYLPPPLARPPHILAATNAAQTGSGTTHASDRPPSHAATVAHLRSNTCILNKEDELHPLNQTAFTMLLREVTEHGSSELEARFDDLMYGLHPDRVAVFRLRLEERRSLLHEHPNTAAQHASSTPVASQPSVPTPTAKAADDLADQLQSVRITGGATPVSHRTTPTTTPTPTPAPTPTQAPANRVVVPPLRLNSATTPVPMTQPTTHTYTPQSQTPLEQQVADLQQQVQQLMTLVKGKQEAVTPRERADFLAAQTALAERVTLAESKVNKSLDLAQRALDAANSALNTLPQCVSVELATNLQTQINSAVTGINDLNGRVADVKTQLDTRPPTDNPATMHVDVEDLANLRSALDDRIDHGARTTEDIRTTLNARIDTEAARIAQLTKSVDDLERKSALFLNYTAQPSLDVDETNSRIAEALSSADTANVTANSAYGLANTTNQTVEHMRTRFDNIDTALAHTTHDFNYVWSHIALLLDRKLPCVAGRHLRAANADGLHGTECHP